MKTVRMIAIVSISLWLMFAATPRIVTTAQIQAIVDARVAAALPAAIQASVVSNSTPAQDTSTGVLTLPETPRVGSEQLYVNGVRQKPIEDYTISGATITPVPANVDLYKDPAAVLLAGYLR